MQTYIITSGRISHALIEQASFIQSDKSPMKVTDQIYFLGTVNDILLYIDANQPWSNTRVIIGQKEKDEPFDSSKPSLELKLDSGEIDDIIFGRIRKIA